MKKKKPYVKPTISKLQHANNNKYGTSPYYGRKVRESIDGCSVDKLVKEYGSPLFVFSERKIRDNVRRAKQAFSTVYPKTTFGWSYKTNYLNAICAIFHQEGCLAEVVSEMEYEKARRLGVKGENIIFNGPNKSKVILKQAIEEGARIHVDHFDEIEMLETLLKESQKTLPIAIRLNLDAGIHPLWSRFGFNLESGQALDAVKRIKNNDKFKLVGLHCHIGTFILEPDAYIKQVDKMMAFGQQLLSEFGIKIEYYDLGGGFPSVSRLKGSLLSPDVLVPKIEQYADAIGQAVLKNCQGQDKPEIVLESGRALIDDAGYLITTVCASKRLPDTRKSYVLDAGVNLLYTSTWFQYQIELGSPSEGVGEPSLLNGPLCMNIDVVDEGTLLPPLKQGSRLILSPVGAYNVTQSMQFIEYRPAVVLVCCNGEVAIVQERENLESFSCREKMPKHLRLS